KQSKDERANRAHRQRDRNRVGEIGNACVEVLGHWRDYERKKEKIERIERPSQEASQERVSLIAVERFEEPRRFHRALTSSSHPEKSRRNGNNKGRMTKGEASPNLK